MWAKCSLLQYQASAQLWKAYLVSAVERDIRDLIWANGRITFAQFMETCLYSPKGGFYSGRGERISAHFGTSSSGHPVFGALIARQLEQMWRLLEEPPVFHVIEVGSGDGELARSIADACRRTTPRFAESLYYVAADYQPGGPQSPGHATELGNVSAGHIAASRTAADPGFQRVKTKGVRAFRNGVGCVLSNELIDNFPVHRLAIRDGRVQEVYVTIEDGNLTEILDEPSTPRIEERLTGLGLSLPEGYRGEVNLAIEDWTREVSEALSRGFVLTIDYGEQAADLYSPANAQGTLVCHNRHTVDDDPYRDIAQQDITCQVDFTSLMRAGERQGLETVGFTHQRRFLESLGFSSCLDDLETQSLSAARKELSRIAMMTLVDPDEYGGFKVLAQAKGVGSSLGLLGFQGQQN